MFLIFKALYYFCIALEVLIFLRVILSWIPIRTSNQFLELIHTLTEPILGPIRAMINRSIFGGKGSMLDFSPLVALLIIQLVQNYLRGLF